MTERAGVSQGAQSHHFPHRVDLVASAFEHLAEQRSARYAERARELGGDRATRLRALLDMLWEDFSSPLFTVAAKLWVAAADDEELRERLIPVERRIYSNTAKIAREVAGDLGERARLRPQAGGRDEHGRRASRWCASSTPPAAPAAATSGRTTARRSSGCWTAPRCNARG